MKKQKPNPRNRGQNQRVMLLLTIEDKARLDALKESSGMPLTEILRRALAMYTKTQQ